MFVSKLAPRLGVLRRVTCAFQAHGELLNSHLQPVIPTYCSLVQPALKKYTTAADNTQPPRWIQFEPELDDMLVPRKLSLSPLESWLSLRYALPPLSQTPLPLPQENVELLEEKVLPPVARPVVEEDEGSVTPLRCKNVLQIRRRKMNRHKYKKLQKRTKFLRRRVMEGRGKKKQKRFEEDLERIWKRAGLKKAPEGWMAPKLFIKQHGNRKN